MKIPSLEGASEGNPELRQALAAIQTYLSALEDDLGVNPLASAQAKKRQHTAPPPLMTFLASGVDGNIVVSMSLPQNFTPASVLFHQVRTEATLPFDDDAFTTVETPNTYIVIPDPAVTKYVAIRSRYQDSEFNEWTLQADPVTT